MNYTGQYNSDYMMKLRHIGAQLIEDKEFEQKLNEKLKQVRLGPNSLLATSSASNIFINQRPNSKKSAKTMIKK
jgi:hypothetical protein